MNNYFDEATSISNLLAALKRCCRNVRWKDSTVKYERNALINSYKLQQAVRNGNYKLYSYQRFVIYEPKIREILATRLRDRQMQMALCMCGLYKDLTEHFIYDNCACQIGKGTDFAIDRTKYHLREYYKEYGADGWVLKCDIHHFFPDTNHEIAKAAVRKRVTDIKAADYVCDVIDSFGGTKGIGLGSQVSQLVELAVLDGIDHFIKEKLKIKHYIRYMDDFVLIHHDKEYLKLCKTRIAEELVKLKLELNSKTTIYKLKQGVKFIGWRFLLRPTGKVITLLAKKKVGIERRKLRKILAKEHNHEMPKGTGDVSFICWLANARRGNSTAIVKNMTAWYNHERSNYEP